MPDVDTLAVVVSTIVLFVIGSAYYAVLPTSWVAATGAAGEHPKPWQLAVEAIRCLVLAAIVAGLASQAGVDDLAGGLVLGLALWIGFPLVLWTGAIAWEGTSPKLAALHGGDWLVKLLVVGAIVTAW